MFKLILVHVDGEDGSKLTIAVNPVHEEVEVSDTPGFQFWGVFGLDIIDKDHALIEAGLIIFNLEDHYEWVYENGDLTMEQAEQVVEAIQETIQRA